MPGTRTQPPPEDTSEGPTADPSAARLDALEAKLDRIADLVDQFANLKLPSPEALDALEIRLQAVEDRPDPVDYGDPDDHPEPRLPPPALCKECGGSINGPHFDDCSIGHGADALPKTAGEREAAERRERRNA